MCGGGIPAVHAAEGHTASRARTGGGSAVSGGTRADEDDAAALYVGAPITVTFEDLGVKIHATVSAVVPEIDSAARIIIGEAALTLDPGMDEVVNPRLRAR